MSKSTVHRGLHNADFLSTAEGDTPAHPSQLERLDSDGKKARPCSEPVAKAHGRIERRHVDVPDFRDPRFKSENTRQAFRIRRDREALSEPGSASSEIAGGTAQSLNPTPYRSRGPADTPIFQTWQAIPTPLRANMQ